jgi:hypothetical protein
LPDPAAPHQKRPRSEINHAIVDGRAGASSAYLRSIPPVKNCVPDPIGPNGETSE